MHHRRSSGAARRLATRCLLVATFVGTSAAAADADKASSPMQGKASSEAMHRMMGEDMKEMNSMKMSGDMDHDFATMMRRHHQSGIEMAKMQLQSGKDPEMRKIAQKILDGQQKEIEELDRWLKGHQAPGK